jgi:hypothetical protein
VRAPPLTATPSIVRARLGWRLVTLGPTTGRDLVFDLLGLADELGAILAGAWPAGALTAGQGATDIVDRHFCLLGVLPFVRARQTLDDVASGRAGGWPRITSGKALLAAKYLGHPRVSCA